MGIVDVSLLIVVENIVGFLDRLELGLRLLSFDFRDFIRVTGKSGLLENPWSVCVSDQHCQLCCCLSFLPCGTPSGPPLCLSLWRSLGPLRMSISYTIRITGGESEYTVEVDFGHWSSIRSAKSKSFARKKPDILVRE